MSAYEHDDDSGLLLDQRIDAYMDIIAGRRLSSIICVLSAAADNRTCTAGDRQRIKRSAAILGLAIEDAAETLAKLEENPFS